MSRPELDCDCGYNGDLYLCINGQVYGPCENENCGGACEIESDCDCACHVANPLLEAP